LLDTNAMNRRILDFFALAILMILTGFFAARLVNFAIPPMEDAAMLMRYAENLAQGQGIVWNVGEPPLDGATDFLFMVIIALVCRIGFTVETAVRLVTIISHFATVGLIYAGMRNVQRSGIVPAFLSALYFAVGPGLFLSAAYFGTPLFAFGVALAWLFAQRLLSPEGRTVRAYVSFSVVCLATSLVRPEGTLICAFMLAAVGILIPRREFWRLTAVFGGIFLLLGGTYFLWRWHYFGHPLPNPFYKKGGGHLYLVALKSSLRNSFSLAVPFIPMFLLAVRSRKSLRKGIAFLIPIVGATCMWILLSDEMNFGARFQYPILALYVLSWYPLIRGLPEEYGLPNSATLTAMQKVAIVSAVVTVLGFVFRPHILKSRQITYTNDGRYDIGVMLRQYADRGYTIATTEAGLLPLYSRWRAIDTWGLNDRWIARNGCITYDYLVQQKPDIIMWHEFFSPRHPPSGKAGIGFGIPWFQQVMTLKQYAEKHDFTLAAVFGRSPDDTHYYYIRPDLLEHDEIVQAIRSTPYRWFGDGLECTNYAEDSGEDKSIAQQGAPADADKSYR